MRNVRESLYYEALWAAIPYPAFVIIEKNIIADANNSAEFFCVNSLKHLISKPIVTYVGKNNIILNAINQARRTQVSVILYDVDVAWSNKVHSVHDVIATPVYEFEGNILLVFHPHGMSKKMDRSLSHRSAAKSVTGMAAMLAHEIKNPLAGISGASQLLAANVSEEDLELLDIIQTEVKRIGTLVDSFQTFGDIRPVKQDSINIHDVLSQAKRAASAGYADHVKIIEDYDPSLPLVKGDAQLLLQVVQNLLKNAAEAVPGISGQILISTSFKQGIRINYGNNNSEKLPLQVSIIDNGSGVPEQLKNEIFEPFVTSKANGSGLGLSLVSKIISDLGGVVEYSRAQGKTTFTLLLPVWAEKPTGGSF
jgi:two-component system nitrogen regulation sensor histidine kinase GlnL